MKIKVDTTGVETQPSAIKPGLYTVKIKDIEAKESGKGKPMMAVIFEISGGEFDGRTLYDYIMLDDDSMAWKLASFQDALGLPRKATIDTEKLVGKKVQVRTVVQKSEEFGEQARVRNILAVKGAKAAEEDLEDDEDDEEEVDYEELTLKELKQEVAARELEIEGKETKKNLIAALEENDDEDEDEEEDAEEDDDDDDDEEVDYEELSLKELKAEIAERELEIDGKETKKKLIAALEANDEEDDDDDDDEDEDDDEEEEEQDYSEWDLEDLKKELKERGLKTTGPKAKLIARLEKDDEKGEDGEPF